MEISIKNDKQIEELADQIIGLSDSTTNTSEIKSEIINLINDQLYHQIKNVTLSTIIKEQIDNNAAPSVAEKEIKESMPTKAKPAKSKSTTSETTPVNTIFKTNAASLADDQPKDQTGQPINLEPVASAEEAPEVGPQVAPDKAPVSQQPTVQSTNAPVKQPEPTPQPAPQPMPSNVNTADPLTQYEQLGEPETGSINYNDHQYPFSVSVIKRGAMAGKKMIVVKSPIDDYTANYLANNPDVRKRLEQEAADLNARYQGQTPTNINVTHKLIFTMAAKPSLNSYVNDLDAIVHAVERAVAEANMQTAKAPDQP